MINLQWLKLPTSQKNVHGPKDVPAIEILLQKITWLLLPYLESFIKQNYIKSSITIFLHHIF